MGCAQSIHPLGSKFNQSSLVASVYAHSLCNHGTIMLCGTECVHCSVALILELVCLFFVLLSSISFCGFSFFVCLYVYILFLAGTGINNYLFDLVCFGMHALI